MNYYNPYYMMAPLTPMRPGLSGMFRTLGRGFNLSSIINGTQKTLGLVNQAIPVVKQITPVMRNAKTMFKVMNEFKKTDVPDNLVNASSRTTEIAAKETGEVVNEGGPTFFA